MLSESGDLRGFCLSILRNILFDYRQKNPFKYYIPSHLTRLFIANSVRMIVIIRLDRIIQCLFIKAFDTGLPDQVGQ